MKIKIYKIIIIAIILSLITISVIMEKKSSLETFTDYDLLAMTLEGNTIISPPSTGYYYMSKTCEGMDLEWDSGKRVLKAKGTSSSVAEAVGCKIDFQELNMNITVDGEVVSSLANIDMTEIFTLNSSNCGTSNIALTESGLSIIIIGDKPTTCSIDLSLAPVLYTYETNTPHEYVVPLDGTYRIELWGAEGGKFYSIYVGGRGGYAKGEISLTANEKLYFYTGQQAINERGSTLITTTFNGGAHAEISYYDNTYGFGGGGATDVRYFQNDIPNDLSWNTLLGLRSRIMVAGGAGGASWKETANSSIAVFGGSGGGLIGYDGQEGCHPGYCAQTTLSGYGATQISSRTINGSFGVGGIAPTNRTTGGGGGGGYYGGGGGYGGVANGFGGGGGSSFISGHTGCVAISSSDTTVARTDTTNSTLCSSNSSSGYNAAGYNTDPKCSEHYSGKKFTNTLMIDGSGYKWEIVNGSLVKTLVPMPNPLGGTYDSNTGHTGNGYARITHVPNL